MNEIQIYILVITGYIVIIGCNIMIIMTISTISTIHYELEKIKIKTITEARAAGTTKHQRRSTQQPPPEYETLQIEQHHHASTTATENM